MLNALSARAFGAQSIYFSDCKNPLNFAVD
jgi:hypothetical protein